MFRKTTVLSLLKDELYQAEREVIGQEERCHRLAIAAEQAEVQLKHNRERMLSLRAQVLQNTPSANSSSIDGLGGM